jgi:hypothetical protein
VFCGSEGPTPSISRWVSEAHLWFKFVERLSAEFVEAIWWPASSKAALMLAVQQVGIISRPFVDRVREDPLGWSRGSFGTTSIHILLHRPPPPHSGRRKLFWLCRAAIDQQDYAPFQAAMVSVR